MPTARRPKRGDVVLVNFAGAMGTKRRPAVVVSGDQYHAQRPDAIIGLITTNIAAATAATDHVLRDWRAAGLRGPSAFRTFLITPMQSHLQIIGQVSEYDSGAIHQCVGRALF